MTVYFTADSHFGHKGIIRLSDRPFRSVQHMDDGLIARWNARVAPEDHVYHLGDFCFTGSKGARKVLEKLNGAITLVRGNHDSENTQRLDRWERVVDLLEIAVGGQRLVLCHYPLMEWPGAFKGVLHLHGHTHGAIPPNRMRADVGVDVWGYRPVRLEEIRARLADAAPFHPTDNYPDRAQRSGDGSDEAPGEDDGD
ncbi:MAG: metallophosphoesterase family protein [Pseudomonadota bacterium]